VLSPFQDDTLQDLWDWAQLEAHGLSTVGLGGFFTQSFEIIIN